MQRAKFLSLPAEVVETVLVSAAVNGCPTAIAALAQTCHFVHTLVYETSDDYLWRKLFLTTFDDPRRLLYYNSDKFRWGAEFQERVWAACFLKRHALPLRVQKIYTLRSRTSATSIVDLTPAYDTPSSVRMLNALLAVIRTTAPDQQPHYLLPSPAGNSTFPTDESLLHDRSLSFTHHATSELPIRLGYWGESLSVQWLQAVLKHGLPAPLIVKISAHNRGIGWDETPEALALGELIACTGFIPVKNLTEEQSGRLASTAGTRANGSASGMLDIDMTIEAQQTRAHHRARELVFDMEYLSRRKSWGPYLPAAPSRASETDLDPSLAHDACEELRPDWTWLAAARVVLERILRKTGVHKEILDEFISWNMWREAWTTPTYLGIQRPCYIPDADLSATKTRGERRGENGSTNGDQAAIYRDWAGVQGVWRRYTAWLDYADLIHHNLFGGLDDPGLRELIAIVPVRLRVVGYDPPAVAEHPDRPTIKVEGETGGQFWEGSEEGVWDDVRRIHGTVSMLVNGNVRWSLFTSEEDNHDVDLWASEGVQVGAVGSDAGVIGCWTGVDHRSTEPLGPFWQWRVV